MFTWQVKAITAAIVLAAAATAAAVVDVTETPGPHILYRPDGTSETFKTLAECVAAAPVAAAPGAKSRCTSVTNITKVGSCEGEAEPELPAEIEAIATQCPNDDNRWYTRVQGWKRGAYPACGWELVMLPEGVPSFCTDVLVTAYTPHPDDAPTPDIDPEFDEHSPTGPGPGPPGAGTVDKP